MNTANISFTNLKESPEYYLSVISLIESEFEYDKNFSFKDDFSAIFRQENHEHVLMLIDEESKQVVSTLSYLPKTLLKNQHLFPVVFIGGIATRKDYTRQGLFRRLMNHVILVNQQKVGLFMLWSNHQGLYEKFHFHLAGGILETDHNSHFSYNEYTNAELKNLSIEDIQNIKSIYSNEIESKHFAIKRTENDWELFFKHSSTKLFIKRAPENQISSYYLIGKGHDLKEIVHEFAPLDQQSAYPEKTWLPEYAIENNQSGQMQYTAYMRLGSQIILEKFINQLAPSASLKIKKIQEFNVMFSYQNQNYELSEEDFLHSLFGPNPINEFSNLKLSPYISGLESI